MVLKWIPTTGMNEDVLYSFCKVQFGAEGTESMLLNKAGHIIKHGITTAK